MVNKSKHSDLVKPVFETLGSKTMRYIFTLIIASLFSMHAQAENPDCSGVNRWATNMAYAQLKNEGYVTPESVNFNRTNTRRIASEKIGDDLYKQVHHIVFTLKNGSSIKVIAVNDASSEECSMSSVEIYVVSKQI